MPGPRSVRLTLAGGARVLLLSYLASACTVPLYQSTATVPPVGAAPMKHASVHLVGDTAIYRMRNVIMDADSLVGFSEASGARLAIPASSVSLVETRSVSAVRTAGLVAGIIAGVTVLFVGVLAYAMSQSSFD